MASSNDGEKVLTEHGYNVVFWRNVPFPPFMKPSVLDEVRYHNALHKWRRIFGVERLASSLLRLLKTTDAARPR